MAMLFMVSFQFCFSKNAIEYKTWNTANETMQGIRGQSWPHELTDFLIASLRGLSNLLGKKCGIFVCESSRKVAISWLPVLSHHRTYRSVYGGLINLIYSVMCLR